MSNAQDIVEAVNVPYELRFDGAKVIISALEAVDDVLVAQVVYQRGGVDMPFSNPWKIANPPIHVVMDGEAVNNPSEAFREIILTAGFFRG